jgi:hypothetical protein
MREPKSHEFQSPRGYYHALLQAGLSPSKAEQRVQQAWRKFQDDVRNSDPYEWSDLEQYVSAMVLARLETSEIIERYRDAKARWEGDLIAQDSERQAHERMERELELDEVRHEAALARMRVQLGLADQWEIDVADAALHTQGSAPADDAFTNQFGPWTG